MDIENLKNRDIKNNFLKIKTFYPWLLFIILGGLAILIPLRIKERLSIQKQAQTVSGVSLTLSTDSISLNQGNIFLVKINLNTHSATTSGISVIVNYDPKVIEVINLSPPLENTTLTYAYPQVLENKIDTTAGKINFAAGVRLPDPNYFAGQGLVAEIQAKVKDNAPVGQTFFTFDLADPANPRKIGDCDVISAANNEDILNQVNNLTLNIQVSSLTPIPSFTPSPTLFLSVTPSPTSTLFPTSTPQLTPSPTLTSTPTSKPTVTPTPLAAGCKAKGGICCRGFAPNCQTKLIDPYVDTSSGGCSVAKTTDYLCCKSCLYGY